MKDQATNEVKCNIEYLVCLAKVQKNSGDTEGYNATADKLLTDYRHVNLYGDVEVVTWWFPVDDKYKTYITDATKNNVLPPLVSVSREGGRANHLKALTQVMARYDKMLKAATNA